MSDSQHKQTDFTKLKRTCARFGLGLSVLMTIGLAIATTTDKVTPDWDALLRTVTMLAWLATMISVCTCQIIEAVSSRIVCELRRREKRIREEIRNSESIELRAAAIASVLGSDDGTVRPFNGKIRR